MRLLFLIPFLMMIALPAKADDAEILKRLDAIEKRLSTIEASNPLQTLFAQGMANAAKRKQEPGEKASEKSDLTLEPPPFSVKILSIKPGGQDVLGQQIATIKVAVTNVGARDTDIINAAVDINDRAGNNLLHVKWIKNRGIGAGKTLTMESSYSGSGSLNGEKISTLLEIDPSLLAASFDVYKIAFKGGEVTAFKECFMCDF